MQSLRGIGADDRPTADLRVASDRGTVGNVLVQESETFDIDDLPEVDGDRTEIGGGVQLQAPFGFVAKVQHELVDTSAEMVSASDPMLEISDALFLGNRASVEV